VHIVEPLGQVPEQHGRVFDGTGKGAKLRSAFGKTVLHRLPEPVPKGLQAGVQFLLARDDELRCS
jgi:hypothetical protein